uniref:Reticulon-like protein n=1 Tax=Anthurium amnicola TaxID=1678845 RepID=A0A1D1XUA7_9ARAE
MQASASRRSSTRTNGVVAGSVWETRMKLDQVKGGIRVFNADDPASAGAGDDEGGLRVYNLRLRRNQSEVAAEKKKRKNWSPPEAGAVAVGGASPAADKSPPTRLRKTQSASANSPKISDKGFMEVAEGKAVARSLSIAGGFDGGATGLLEMGDDMGDRESGPGDGGDAEEEIGIETGRKSFDDKEVDMGGEKSPGNAAEEEVEVEINPISSDAEETAPEAMEEHPAVDHDVVSASPMAATSDVVRRPSPLPPKVTKPTTPGASEEEFYENMTETHHRMQSIVDLVMWREISRSAFVFGIGSFLLLSSSYTKDLNFSLISAISYMGLVYLAAIFLYKSIIRRGAVDLDEASQGGMVGEEEAIWLVRLLLPYVNEVLHKLKALFSGDPATTMKLAVMLFVMARCGGSITFWTMAKLAFFGVFTIPKICSSYSVQLARFGKFWLERVGDAWESCQHKKAVAAAVFTLIWNLSSTVARVWAVFMLVVAVRFYQQRVVAVDEVAEEEEMWDGHEGEEAQRPLQVAAEDSKLRHGLGRGGGRGRAAAGGQVGVQQLGPGRGHRQLNGPTRVVVTTTREKKKWS